MGPCPVLPQPPRPSPWGCPAQPRVLCHQMSKSLGRGGQGPGDSGLGEENRGTGSSKQAHTELGAGPPCPFLPWQTRPPDWPTPPHPNPGHGQGQVDMGQSTPLPMPGETTHSVGPAWWAGKALSDRGLPDGGSGPRPCPQAPCQAIWRSALWSTARARLQPVLIKRERCWGRQGGLQRAALRPQPCRPGQPVPWRPSGPSLLCSLALG